MPEPAGLRHLLHASWTSQPHKRLASHPGHHDKCPGQPRRGRKPKSLIVQQWDKTTVGCCSSQVLKGELETSALPSMACSSQTIASRGPTLPTPNPVMPEVTTLHLPYTHSQLSAPVGLRLPKNKKPRKAEVPLARRSVGPGLSTTQRLL